VRCQHPAFFKAERVDQLGNPLTSGQLAGGMLFGVALLATSGDDSSVIRSCMVLALI
jgi:hypothetical protein